MKRAVVVCTILLSLTVKACFAQEFEWVRTFSGSAASSGYGRVADMDSAGNIVTGGYFEGILDFDPGQFELELSGWDGDGYVSKLNAAGQLLWARNIGGYSTDRLRDLKCHTDGSTIAVGEFEDLVDFAPGVAVVELNGGSGAGYILKYDYWGALEWVTALGGECNSVSLDSDGYVYVTGSFQDSLQAQVGQQEVQLHSLGGEDVFIAKLDPSGNILWVKQVGGAVGYDVGQSVAVSAEGNIFVSGVIIEGADLDPGPDTLLVGGSNLQSVFVLKLTNNGELIWPLAIRVSPDISNVTRLEVDAFENLYMTGILWSTIDFDPSPDLNLLSSNGDSDVFLVKYDTDANLQWATGFGGSSTDYPRNIALDFTGNAYCVGLFNDTLIFSDSTQIVSQDQWDGYLTKFTPDGQLAWASSIAGGKYDDCGAITIDDSLNIYITGNYMGDADFDPGSGVYQLENQSLFDVFVVKLAYCPSEAQIVSGNPLELCAGDSVILATAIQGHEYNWNTGDTTSEVIVYEEGDYYVTVIDTVVGCVAESNTISVSVNQVDVEIIDYPDQNLFESSITASSYQWYLNGEPIPWANGQFYIPTESGTYWLVVADSEGCEATSPILEYTLQVGVEERDASSRLKVFPNPATDQLTITSGGLASVDHIALVDMLGRTIVGQNVRSTNFSIDVSEVQSGVYFVVINLADGSSSSHKVMIQK